ncbi:monocarboxylate transporter 5-like [Strongylocentrotus purpuratus]|uniref:Monocarboxylate transporter n=1 Tax=Strongylocentrotus purpuratus TaxID=7668 RepID=A0A7M7PR67_STRPU|nr:monocarboxylate transporter 5-like [Strongylocentrotus purpuratus]
MPFMLVVNDFFPDGFVLINTISMYGHTAGTMLLPLITEQSLEAYGYEGTFLILGGITLNLIVCAVAIREPNLRNPRAGYDQVQGDGSGPSDVQDKERIRDNGLENQDASVTKQHFQTGGNSSATSYAEVTRCASIRRPSFEEKDSGEQDLGIETEIGTAESLQLIDGNPNLHTDTPRNVLGEQKESSLRHESGWKSLLLQEPLFWFNLLTIFLFAYAYYSWMFFLVPHAEQLGIAESRAVSLSSIAGVGGIIGRTVFIALVTKDVNAFYIYIVAGIPITISFLLDFIGSDYSTRAGLAFLQGFCFFSLDTLFLAIPKETLVDQDNLSLAIALASFFFGLGALAAGYISGSLFDLTQSYTKVFIIIGIVHAIVIVQVIITTACLRKRKRVTENNFHECQANRKLMNTTLQRG